MSRNTTIQVLRTADKSSVATDSLSAGEFLFDTTSKSLYIGTGTTVQDAVKLNATSGDEMVVKSLSISTSNGVTPTVIDASSDNKSRVKAQYVNATTVNATTLNASIVKIGATTNSQYLILDKTRTNGQLKIGALTVESTNVEISNLSVIGSFTIDNNQVATEGYVAKSTSSGSGGQIDYIKIGSTTYTLPKVSVTTTSGSTIASNLNINGTIYSLPQGGGTSGVSGIAPSGGSFMTGSVTFYGSSDISISASDTYGIKYSLASVTDVNINCGSKTATFNTVNATTVNVAQTSRFRWARIKFTSSINSNTFNATYSNAIKSATYTNSGTNTITVKIIPKTNVFMYIDEESYPINITLQIPGTNTMISCTTQLGIDSSDNLVFDISNPDTLSSELKFPNGEIQLYCEL